MNELHKRKIGRAGFEPAWERPTPANSWERPISVHRSPLAHSGNDPRQGTIGLEPTPLGATIQGSTAKLCTPKQVGRFELPASSLEERHSRPLNYTCQTPTTGIDPAIFSLTGRRLAFCLHGQTGGDTNRTRYGSSPRHFSRMLSTIAL